MSCRLSLCRCWSLLIRTIRGWRGISGGRGWRRREARKQAMTNATARSISSSLNSSHHCRIDIASVEPISPLSNRYSRCPIDSCHLRPFSPSQTSYPPCWTCVDRCGSLGNLLWSWCTSLQEGRRSCGSMVRMASGASDVVAFDVVFMAASFTMPALGTRWSVGGNGRKN